MNPNPNPPGGLDGPLFRDAIERDAADLSILADAATRRLSSWMWEEHSGDGQSNFEVGRTTILTNHESPSYLHHWAVAEVGGRVAGALNSYRLEPVPPSSQRSAAVQQPLIELKTLAAGSWYVSVASVHPEFRRRGLGQQLLSLAERKARTAGIDTVTLIVASFNDGAHDLYVRLGFEESDRRPFHPFPGSDTQGDWILMTKRPVTDLRSSPERAQAPEP